MKEDDEPALSYKRVALSLLIISIFLMGTVTASIAPKVEQKKPIVVKKKIKTISGWFKPNTKRLPYKWYYKTWINKCAYCGHHLHMNPKKVPERELTCSKCGADYDGVQGREKIKGSHKYLKKA